MIAAKFELARVTIEFTSPMIIGTGSGTEHTDAVCVTDANGLPAIPGTTLAGVLRHALAGSKDPETDPRCQQVFGHEEGTEGVRSRLRVSWAAAHDQHNKPVPPIGADWSSDPILSLMRSGVIRDHVRLDTRGVADDRGKFDERLVPAGSRFTFEIALEHGSGVELPALLGLLAAPGFRLGGRTRSGLGAITLIAAWYRSFDLKKRQDRDAFERLPVGLHESVPRGALKDTPVPAGVLPGHRCGTLKLKPEDYLIVSTAAPLSGSRYEYIDRFPYTEPYITWSGSQGKVSERFVIPATAIKGPLRHRTLFHAHRWLMQSGEHTPQLGEGCEGSADATATGLVVEIFGSERDHDTGQPGRLYLSDVALSAKTTIGILQHVSIDRFTGGPMSGMLFGEAPLFLAGQELPVAIRVDRWDALSTGARWALEQAIDDLCGGRLSVGGGDGRGHGYCGGRILWTEASKKGRPEKKGLQKNNQSNQGRNRKNRRKRR